MLRNAFIIFILLLYSCKAGDSSKDEGSYAPWMILQENGSKPWGTYDSFDKITGNAFDAKEKYYSNYKFAEYGFGNGFREEKYVNDLKKKIPLALTQSRKAKYEEQLKQYSDKLQTQYKDRIQERLEFLQAFYSDLYLLKREEFTKKYKHHCMQSVLNELKRVYHKNHGTYGYAWNIFTDNTWHKGSEFRFIYLDGNPGKVTDKLEALYMFGDSVNYKKPKYRYTNFEDKWFQVSMGNHHIMVQINGNGKEMYITGLVNPYTKNAVKLEERDKNAYHIFQSTTGTGGFIQDRFYE